MVNPALPGSLYSRLRSGTPPVSFLRFARTLPFWTVLALLLPGQVLAQEVSDAGIRQRIEAYKKDPRGPYKYLRWFCFDGRVNPPQEPCGNNEGVQRAAYKDGHQVVPSGRWPCRTIFLASRPLMACPLSSSQTMAPVGQRCMASSC